MNGVRFSLNAVRRSAFCSDSFFGERLFSVQRLAFGVRGCSCSVFCSAPFAACCFVWRAVRKGWACGVLFDVVFGFRVLFGVVFGKAWFVHRFVQSGLLPSAWYFTWRVFIGEVCFVQCSVQHTVFCLAFCSDELNVWTFV